MVSVELTELVDHCFAVFVQGVDLGAARACSSPVSRGPDGDGRLFSSTVPLRGTALLAANPCMDEHCGVLSRSPTAPTIIGRSRRTQASLDEVQLRNRSHADRLSSPPAGTHVGDTSSQRGSQSESRAATAKHLWQHARRTSTRRLDHPAPGGKPPSHKPPRDAARRHSSADLNVEQSTTS
jgi:hypothetical protein